MSFIQDNNNNIRFCHCNDVPILPTSVNDMSSISPTSSDDEKVLSLPKLSRTNYCQCCKRPFVECESPELFGYSRFNWLMYEASDKQKELWCDWYKSRMEDSKFNILF